jgi:cell cycle arrest protein BUB3
MSNESALSQPPADGITSLVFANQSDRLLVSSWDSTVRLYDARRDQLLRTVESKSAVLDCCFSDDENRIFHGGIDQELVMTDVSSGQQTSLGSHDKAIKCVTRSGGLVFTGGWDCAVKVWDHRQRNALVHSTTQEGCKVYSMSLAGQKLVVATSNRQIFIYDMRQPGSAPPEVRESALMHQTRCVRGFPDGQGFVVSSVEGRVAIEYLDPSPEVQAQKYAFKCHRNTDPNTQAQVLFPVNAVAFHPQGTFATGGAQLDNVRV